MLEIRIGDVLRMRNWEHHTQGVHLTYGVGRQPKDKKTVAMMLLLGYEPYDGQPGLDLEKRMNELGWFRKET